MLSNLSQTLENLLLAELNNRYNIAFQRPAEPFPGAEKSTIGLFLYDVRENVELRSNVATINRYGGSAAIRRPPVRVACSYLVTAWPKSGGPEELPDLALQEQRMLGQVFGILASHPTIPAAFFNDGLTGQEDGLPMVTLHGDSLKNPWEFWTALQSKMKPSFTVTVTINVFVYTDITGPIVTTTSTGYGMGAGTEETVVQMGGQVLWDSGDGRLQGVAGALVDITEAGLRTKTGSEGYYTFSRITVGTHQVRISATGFEPQVKTIVVPGSPQDYQIIVVPLEQS